MTRNTKKVLLAVTFLLSGLFASIGFSAVVSTNEDNSAVAPGNQLVEVASGLYVFGPGMAYGVFLVTDESVVVIDPINSTVARNMKAAITSVTDLPVSHLLYSHNHWDHIGGGQVFKDDGATILAHRQIADWLSIHPNLNPEVLVPDQTWDGERHDLTVGGKQIELHHFGPSHGLGMTVFRFPAENAVFVVDLIVPERVGFAYMPDFTPRGWLASLDKIEALEFDQIMFGHKDAVGPRSSLNAQRQFVLDLQNEINTQLKALGNPMKVIENLELPKYKDWAGYDVWLKMNAWRIMLETTMGH